MSKTVIYCPIVGCGAVATDKHHIGGPGSPTVWLCHNCHGRLHGISWQPDHAFLTRQGIAKAHAEGRRSGNPGLLAGDPEALRKLRDARRAVDLAQLISDSAAWMPTVVAMRPASPWGDVIRAIGGGMTTERLRRAVHRLVKEGLADGGLLGRAPQIATKHRLADLIAALAETRTLQQVCQRLEDMGERTPRGAIHWHPSSVRHLMRKPLAPSPHDARTAR